jgi:hypothetical protein
LDSTYTTRSNTNTNNSALVSISEEENPPLFKQQTKSKIIPDDIDDSNPNQYDQKRAPNLSKNNTCINIKVYSTFYTL